MQRAEIEGLAVDIQSIRSHVRYHLSSLHGISAGDKSYRIDSLVMQLSYLYIRTDRIC